MPNPLLCGFMGGLLNFLSYIGAVIGIVASACMVILSFDTVGQALPIPGAYWAPTMIEGQSVTPVLPGRRFSLNTVTTLIAIAFWGFVWSAMGVLIAVPSVIILKVICDRVDGFAPFAEFLSGGIRRWKTGLRR